MSRPFKTVSQVIAALTSCDTSTQLHQVIHLQKINVTFSKSGYKNDGRDVLHQTYEFVQWDSDDFNNLELSTSTPTNGRCGGCCKTIGELLDKLREFKNKYGEDKSIAVTYNLSLLDGDIIEMKPLFKTIVSASWATSTLADGHRATLEITEHLTKLVDQLDWHKSAGIFTFIQQFIETHPSRPRDYKVYLITNSAIKNDDSVGFKAFSSLREAKAFLKKNGMAELNTGSSSVSILDSPKLFLPYSENTPNVFLYRTLFVNMVKNDLQLIEQKLANLDV